MPPKTKRKNAIGRRERRALGIPSPVDAADPVELLPAPAPAVDIGVNAAAAAPADEPNLSESMVMVTPEEQQQQRQPWNSPMGMAEESSRLSPIAAADESMNQTDLDYEAQGSPRLNMMDSSDSSMGSSPTPIFRKMLGMKKKSPRKSPRRNSPPPRRKSSPRRNSPRAQTFRRKSKLAIDKPEYLKASPSVAQIRDKLMGLAQVASRTRKNSIKINEYTEKIRRTLDELNPYFLFIQQYIAGRGEIQRELDAAVVNRGKMMEERERLVGDLADKSQMNANSKIQEVAEGQIGILNDQISELNKRIEELTAQLESSTRANQMYENILRDIPADIDKMRGFIDAEDATLSESITGLDQVLSNFSNQLKQRLQDTLPQDQHAAFNSQRGGSRQSRKYRPRKQRKMTRKSRKQRKMTRKSRK
jgi:predicted  nucleic acid-binding Zn-ribbon protein